MDNRRVSAIKPLISPALLKQEIQGSEIAYATASNARKVASDIISGDDDRLLIIVGPCSIHDVDAAIEYGTFLKKQADRFSSDLFIIMRVYFEKPRTSVGWKGLINDPNLDGSFEINKGLRIARSLLATLNGMGLPTGCELLDTISPQFISDLIAWGAIGARTTESQIHRELASGMSCPIGFKNGTDGNVKIAMDAIRASEAGHHFLGVTDQGLAAIVHTTGNTNTHIILRGSTDGPNYDEKSVDKIIATLKENKRNPRIMIDCSHGNSQKLHTNQPIVAQSISQQVSKGNYDIIGAMIESNLVDGKQDLERVGIDGLVYGKSITDACIDCECTVTVLEQLASAVRKRRELKLQ